MKQKHFLHLFLSFLMLAVSINGGYTQVPGYDNAKNPVSFAMEFLFNRYTKSPVFEKISYDERKEVFTDLPKEVDITKLHYLDIPSIITIKEVRHIDEVLTAGGEYVKIITYISREGAGDKWPNEAKYRIFLADKVIALNENMEVIAETPNTAEYIKTHNSKGLNAMTNGLLQWLEFRKLDKAVIEAFEEKQFKLEMKGDEYRFIKGEEVFSYNPSALFFGQVQKEGETIVHRYNYFKRHNDGNLIPKFNYVYYQDKLPTGGRAFKSEFVHVSNFQLTGKRYENQLTGRIYEKLNTEKQSGIRILSINPNPAKNSLQFRVLIPDIAPDQVLQYQIIDVNGKVVLTENRLKLNSLSGINISALPAGVYLLKVTLGRRVLQQKFVKD